MNEFIDSKTFACHKVTFLKNLEIFSLKIIIIIIVIYILRRIFKKSVYLVDMITRDKIIWKQRTKKISSVDDFVLCLNEGFLKKLSFEFYFF